MTPSGSKPKGDGKYGQSDLAVNLWEWVLDRYTSPYNETSCIHCACLTAGSSRIVRGGDADDLASSLVAGYRRVVR